MLKKCEFCGEEFETRVHNKIYCSSKCRNNVAKKIKGACEYCGSEFNSANKMQKFCSIECSNNTINKPTFKKCGYCNKEFKAKAGRIKFCSNECRWKNSKQLGTTVCKRCGKEFILTSSRDAQFFCSRECYDADRFEKSIIEYKCEYCGIVFRKEGKKTYDYVNGKKRIPKFCSKECADKDRIGRYTGRESSQWKGGVCSINDAIRAGLKSWKKEVLKINDFICFVSGERGCKLVVHHKEPFHLVRDKILIEHGLNKESCLNDCTDLQYEKILDSFDEIHNINLGIVLRQDIHKLFHKLYGFKASYENLLEFKQRYKNGEFKTAS